MTVHVVTDSTSDIEPQRAAEAGVLVVPLIVSFGDESFHDGIDITNEVFYERLAKSSVLPKTAAPSVGAFHDAYAQAIANGATGILSVQVTGALSGTLNSATLAAQQLTDDRRQAHQPEIPIRVIDSRMVSAGVGYPALLAAERARDGASLDDLVTFIEGVLENAKLIFLLNTLEYLQKAGALALPPPWRARY